MRDSGRISLAVLGIAAVAAVLLVVTEFSTVAGVHTSRPQAGVSDSCQQLNDTNPSLGDRCRLSGFERHGGAFLILGVLAGLMAVGAGPGRSRAAAIALILIGMVVLTWSLTSDRSEAGKTGLIGQQLEGAKGYKGTGFYLELVAGALAIGAGATRLLKPEPGPAND